MKKENPTTEYTEQTPKPASKRELQYAEALNNFSQAEEPELKQKKHKWFMPLVLIIAIGIGVFLIVQMSQSLGDQKSFQEVFGSVSFQNLLWVVLVLLAILVLDITKYVVSLQAITGQLRPLIGTKTSLLGRYYDSITPFAVGGQPVQIYYLHSKGFRGGLSSAVILTKYFFNMCAWTLVALVCMAANTDVLSAVPNGTVIAIVGWVGLVINMSLPTFILFFVLMPKFAHKLTSGVISLGHKLHIVKDKEKVMKRALKSVRDFRSSFILMAKRPLQLVLLIVACVGETALSFAFPYFVVKMFNGIAPAEQTFSTLFDVMALNCYSFFSASIVPTPGSSGAIEFVFTIAFSNVAGATLLWVIFTWRFATYYIYIIIGVCITIFNFIRSLIRVRREKPGATVAADTQPNAEPASTDKQTPPATVEQTTQTELPPSPQQQRIVEVELAPPDDSGDNKK